MVLSARTVRRAVAGTIGAGAIAGVTLFSSVAFAFADPEPEPPGCTAADLAGVAAGVSAGTSAYLFTHPEVNDFFTGLEGQHRADVRDTVTEYLDANPQVKAELTHIRQPLVDIKNRCGGPDLATDDIP
ncbi:heme-binding protein [Mycolicibacterium thermoresistibile]